jgi:hypothetical protein
MIWKPHLKKWFHSFSASPPLWELLCHFELKFTASLRTQSCVTKKDGSGSKLIGILDMQKHVHATDVYMKY